MSQKLNYFSIIEFNKYIYKFKLKLIKKCQLSKKVNHYITLFISNK